MFWFIHCNFFCCIQIQSCEEMKVQNVTIFWTQSHDHMILSEVKAMDTWQMIHGDPEEFQTDNMRHHEYIYMILFMRNVHSELWCYWEEKWFMNAFKHDYMLILPLTYIDPWKLGIYWCTNTMGLDWAKWKREQ